MDFVLFKTEPDAKGLCDYLNANGVPAYVKGTGIEATKLPLGLIPSVFVEEDKLGLADNLFNEWRDTDTLGVGMTEEEKKETQQSASPSGKEIRGHASETPLGKNENIRLWRRLL